MSVGVYPPSAEESGPQYLLTMYQHLKLKFYGLLESGKPMSIYEWFIHRLLNYYQEERIFHNLATQKLLLLIAYN